MNRNKAIMGAMIVGSVLGGIIPSLLWDASPFDISSVLCTALGGILGIWIGYKHA